MCIRIQYISFRVKAHMYEAFKFNLCRFSAIALKKLNILWIKSMSVTFSGISGVYHVC